MAVGVKPSDTGTRKRAAESFAHDGFLKADAGFVISSETTEEESLCC